MKKHLSVFVIYCLFFAGFASASVENATPSNGSADWVVETGTMLVSGIVASNLYLSLVDDEYEIDPRSTNYDQLRIKESAFAKCYAHYLRVDTSEDTIWEIEQETAHCQIDAPEGTVHKD